MDKIPDIETRIDKIKCILNQLYNQLYLGYCSFVLTKQIQRAFVGGLIIHIQELLKTAYFACGNSAILFPITLVEEGYRKENINLNFLFREWEDVVYTLNKIINKRHLDDASIETLWQDQKAYLGVLHQRDDILNSISEHKQKLESLGPTLTVIKEKRDHYIAHLDKRLLQTDRLELPVYTDDLNKIYQELFGIVRTYYDYLDERLEIYNLADLHQILESDFNYLMKCSS